MNTWERDVEFGVVETSGTKCTGAVGIVQSERDRMGSEAVTIIASNEPVRSIPLVICVY
jgi:hypothetical protein